MITVFSGSPRKTVWLRRLRYLARHLLQRRSTSPLVNKLFYGFALFCAKFHSPRSPHMSWRRDRTRSETETIEPTIEPPIQPYHEKLASRWERQRYTVTDSQYGTKHRRIHWLAGVGPAPDLTALAQGTAIDTQGPITRRQSLANRAKGHAVEMEKEKKKKETKCEAVVAICGSSTITVNERRSN